PGCAGGVARSRRAAGRCDRSLSHGSDDPLQRPLHGPSQRRLLALPDGDGHLDISIDDFTSGCTTYGSIPGSVPVPWSRWDALINPVAPAGAGEIHIKRASALSYHIVAHEVFHLFEDAVLPPDTNQWLHEGLAEWAAVRAESAIGDLEQNPDRTMDCVGSVCGDTDFDRNGYPGWMLFEYLAERFG